MHEGLVGAARESTAPRLPCAVASGGGDGCRSSNADGKFQFYPLGRLCTYFSTGLTNLDIVPTFLSTYYFYDYK